MRGRLPLLMAASALAAACGGRAAGQAGAGPPRPPGWAG